MTRQRLTRLVQLGVVVTTIACTARAWSQSSSDGQSLADRIRAMRRGDNAVDAASDADDSPATAPPDQPMPRPLHTPAPTGQGGIPQINAKSLFPSNLFGRASATPNDSQQPQPMPSRGSSTTVKRMPAAIDQSADPQTMPRPRAGSATNPISLGRSTTPSASISNGYITGAPVSKPPVAHLPVNQLPAAKPLIADASPSPVRSSPTQRAPLNFDPEALRNDLAGAFPAPANNEHSTTSNSSIDHLPAKSNEQDVDNSIGPIGSVVTDQSASPRAERAHSPSIPSNSTSDTLPVSHPPFPTVGDLLGHRASSATKVNSAAISDGPVANGDINDTRDAGSKAFQSFGKSRPSDAAKPIPASAPSIKSSDSAADHFNAPDNDADSPKSDGTAVLAANHSPVITTEMQGPKQIMIGRDACYRLQLRNEGGGPANDFIASIRVPSWADVVNTSATKGIVRLPHDSDSKSSGTLDWQIEQLDPQVSETLTLHLVPHESRPLELGISWTQAAIGSKTIVEVQEPKLKMQIAGPDEVLFGKSQVYRLTLSNPGNGTAENVKIDLMPPGGNESTPTTHKIGNLAPGATKTVEVELTARQAGKLSVKATASAEGGLSSDATKELFCRKPELEVDWRGPESQYAGTAATYYFRVRNPGTAAAEDVTIRVSLPDGAKFVSASDGQVYDPDHHQVLWHVGSLRPGDDCYTELKCNVTTLGKNQFQVAAATAEGDLTDSKVAATNVVGLADLKLDIKDPPGPLPLGEEAVYEINILNRGNDAAHDVNVAVLFSEGLEPAAADGGEYSVSDGRVSFHVIDKIPAGQTVTLRVHAHAVKSGSHVFRTEVLCKDLEIKLSAEETTRFYQDQLTREDSPASQPMLGANHMDAPR
jgi:uncharacterized repeat protein (TIGR01451 family)